MNKNKLILEMGFRGVSAKGQGVRPAPENPGKVLWSKDDIIEMVYDVAPTIFRKSNKDWWIGTNYDEEDFAQDAAMDMLKRYDSGYIDATSPNLKKIIYALLNNFFIFNKAKSFKRKRQELGLDSPIGGAALDQLGALDSEENYKDMVLDTELDPEERALLASAVNRGEKLINALLDELSVTEFSTRKHEYIGQLNGTPVSFSEKSLAELFLSGKTVNEIISIFDTDKKEDPSKARVIDRKVRTVVDKVADLINNMTEDDRFDIKVFLYSKISSKPSLPDGAMASWRNKNGSRKV